ncbi:MAG: PEP-CTERM sorting domain-containing protein [Verrucomicrobia bacterium]|nr:PEP-CTERM sorting domain-containing protein [Verrucomicrobiota bacterium]
MKTKSLLLSMTCALGMLALGGQANAAVLVTNGNFSDLTGLNYLGGPWYGGVPTGWTGLNTNYTVIYTGNPSPGVFTYSANLQTLSSISPSFSALRQYVGTMPFTGDFTLTFNLDGALGSTYQVGVALVNNAVWDSGTTIGAVQDYTNVTGIQSFTRTGIAAGTPISIGFWTTGNPASVTDVSISVVPEPSTWAMMLLGGVGMLAVLRRRSKQA